MYGSTSVPSQSFLSITMFFAKSKDKIQKKMSEKRKPKIIPECTKSHRLLKKLCPRTPLGWPHADGAQFLPHQPRIDGYVSAGAYQTTKKLAHFSMLISLIQ